VGKKKKGAGHPELHPMSLSQDRSPQEWGTLVEKISKMDTTQLEAACHRIDEKIAAHTLLNSGG